MYICTSSHLHYIYIYISRVPTGIANDYDRRRRVWGVYVWYFPQRKILNLGPEVALSSDGLAPIAVDIKKKFQRCIFYGLAAAL